MSEAIVVPGDVTYYRHGSFGWLYQCVVAPLPPEAVVWGLAGSHPDHALVTIFGPWDGGRGRTAVLERDGFLAPRFFAEKFGPFPNNDVAQDALNAVVEALRMANPPADIKAEERSA